MFGVNFQADDAIIRPLEAQGLRRLYPASYDPKRELKKLNHSILANFLDLLDILIRWECFTFCYIFMQVHQIMLGE